MLVGAGGASAPPAAALAPLEAEVLSLEQLAGDPGTLVDPEFERSELTVGCERVRVGGLTGVVNLVPAVAPELLPFYDEDEREYQAAELHAWLTFFLSSLRCRVVNRPTAVSLTGPALTPLAWRRLAASAGVPSAPVALSSRELARSIRSPAAEGEEVVCVGGRAVDPEGTPAEEHAERLARSTELAYLRTWFDDESRLVGAASVPELRPVATRRALAEYLA